MKFALARRAGRCASSVLSSVALPRGARWRCHPMLCFADAQRSAIITTCIRHPCRHIIIRASRNQIIRSNFKGRHAQLSRSRFYSHTHRTISAQPCSLALPTSPDGPTMWQSDETHHRQHARPLLLVLVPRARTLRARGAAKSSLVGPTRTLRSSLASPPPLHPPPDTRPQGMSEPCGPKRSVPSRLCSSSSRLCHSGRSSISSSAISSSSAIISTGSASSRVISS
jgi:hypothetical protein